MSIKSTVNIKSNGIVLNLMGFFLQGKFVFSFHRTMKGKEDFPLKADSGSVPELNKFPYYQPIRGLGYSEVVSERQQLSSLVLQVVNEFGVFSVFPSQRFLSTKTSTHFYYLGGLFIFIFSYP